MRILRTLVAGCLTAPLLLGGADAGARAPLMIDHIQQECLEIPPHEVPPPAVDTSEALPLEVRVLVQRGDRQLAKQKFVTAIDAFARIGITVKARFQEVDPPSEWGDGTDFSGPDQQTILEFMKGLFGGHRPRGVDVVYFMTRHWAGGFADCIGGVRYSDRAFAFGSIDYKIEGLVPVPTADEGVIAAHEIGHLLGAHHHYSNCAEALPSGATRGDFNPCTTMSPLAATASSSFGVVERSFARRYAELFAKG